MDWTARARNPKSIRAAKSKAGKENKEKHNIPKEGQKPHKPGERKSGRGSKRHASVEAMEAHLREIATKLTGKKYPVYHNLVRN